MSKINGWLLAVLIITGLIAGTPRAALAEKTVEVNSATKARIHKDYGKLPLTFIRNDGQVDEKVKFYERGSGHTTFFTEEGVYISLTKNRKSRKGKDRNIHPSSIVGPLPPSSNPLARKEIEIPNFQSETIKLLPLGANKNPEIIAEDIQKGKVNYFIGNDPKKWKTNIPTYRAVRYKEVYKGIDLRFYGINRQMEYDIIVKPGADPSIVKFSYEGIQDLQVTERGDLEIILKNGSLIQKKPYVYQEIDGKRVEVEGRFLVSRQTAVDNLVAWVEEQNPTNLDVVASLLNPSNNPDSRLPTDSFVYGFEIASYDKNHPIVIDPILVYSTYLGGSNLDYGWGIAVDTAGCAYVTGATASIDFPTQDPLYTDPGSSGWNAFVTKINAAGDALVYSTYLGGNLADYGNGIAVDNAGCAYVTGGTSSTDFPTQDPIYGYQGYSDAFVTKISAAGDALVYSTYLGGESYDCGDGIAVDAAGCAYVTGDTYSPDFPTQDPIYGDQLGMDIFVTKINAAGDALVYSSTYLVGGAYGIAVDAAGCAYVTGVTSSPDFPTQNPIYGDQGDSDAFVTKISAAGDALVYSTYLGGNNRDYGFGIAVDAAGCAYVTGYTNSTDFPTQDPIYTDPGDSNNDAFVTKINAAGDALVYSTYLGGDSDDAGRGIAVDTAGCAYVTGWTSSTNFPTQDPIYTDPGDSAEDIFVTKINAAGDALVYSTYLGGNSDDAGVGIAVDAAGFAYVTGSTYSTDFPTRNPIYTDPGDSGGDSAWDAFVAKIGPKLGDIDQVGDIDIDDVFCLFKYIMGRPSCLDGLDLSISTYANIDKNGDIDIDDVFCLFQCIMGRPSCMDNVD